MVIFRRTETRFWLIPVGVLALLLVGMTLTSVVWHYHDGATAAGCLFCHLSHQPFDMPAALSHAPTFAVVASAAETRDARPAPGPASRRVPVRAPPTA